MLERELLKVIGHGTLTDADMIFLCDNKLEPFYEYLPDCGHSIYAIPTDLYKGLDESKKPSDYICPFPLDYVKEHGFERYNGFLVCEGKYDPMIGLVIEGDYDRW